MQRTQGQVIRQGILFGVLFWLAFAGLMYTPWLRFWNRFGEVPSVLGSNEFTEQVAIIVAGVIAIWLASTVVGVLTTKDPWKED